MPSYRLKRRNFLHAVAGGVGLKVMLGNLEAHAQGSKSPPRLLVTHWPVGAVRTGWAATSGSVGGSAILKPFADAGLAADVTVLRGLSVARLASPSGGGHEAGTVKVVTGVPTPGTRAGEPEQDDAYAGGPSFDQIFLKNVPALQSSAGGAGYANSICDSRVDMTEISTQCLSYGYDTVPVNSVQSGTTTQNKPLMPVLSPLQQWTNLFQGFVPGTTNGGTTGSATGGSSAPSATLKHLVGRKSVLDFSLGELARMRRLVPAASRDNIDIHTAAITNVETQLTAQIKSAGAVGGTTSSTGATSGGTSGPPDAGNPRCIPPTQPSGLGATGGSSGSPGLQFYPLDTAKTDDTPVHAAVGKLHTAIFKAAFVCDLIRVGTFQWSPGNNHVGFKGMMPGETDTIYQHHPVSHRIGHNECLADPLGTIAQFLANVHTWYNQQHASIFADWKATLDGFGNSLLDNTVVPFVTEVEDSGSGWSNMAALIIGGKALGFKHNIYQAGNYTINQFWGTIGQAFGYGGVAPLDTPIDGLWVKPT